MLKSTVFKTLRRRLGPVQKLALDLGRPEDVPDITSEVRYELNKLEIAMTDLYKRYKEGKHD